MWSSDTVDRTATIVVCTPVESRLDWICEWLVGHGYSPLPAATAEAAERLCRYTRPPLLVLDLDLPDQSGLDLLRSRAGTDLLGVSILLLIDRDLDFRWLMRRDPRLAVDDTLRKPFDLDELGGRITTILRRRHSRGDAVVRVGGLLVDPPRRKVLVGDSEVGLSNKEFSLLRVLADDPTRVFSKDELLRAVWGLTTAANTRTLDSHASRLRRKLDPEGLRFVVNAWGIGYKLVESIEVARSVDSDDQESRR